MTQNRADDSENIEIARVIDQRSNFKDPMSLPVRVVVDDPRNDYVCILWVSYPHGEQHCNSFRLAVRESTQRIRARKIRGLPDDLRTADEAVQGEGTAFLDADHKGIDKRWMAPDRRILRSDGSDPLENLEALIAKANPPPRESLREPFDDRHYQKIAQLYDEAIALEENIYPYIGARYPKKEKSTVRQWIVEARKRGHLPPTSPGQKRGNYEPPPPVPKEVIIVETDIGREEHT